MLRYLKYDWTAGGQQHGDAVPDRRSTSAAGDLYLGVSVTHLSDLRGLASEMLNLDLQRVALLISSGVIIFVYAKSLYLPTNPKKEFCRIFT